MSRIDLNQIHPMNLGADIAMSALMAIPVYGSAFAAPKIAKGFTEMVTHLALMILNGRTSDKSVTGALWGAKNMAVGIAGLFPLINIITGLLDIAFCSAVHMKCQNYPRPLNY